MKRRILEWLFVALLLIVIGYFLRMQPQADEFDQRIYIATDLPEKTALNLMKDYPESYQWVLLGQLDSSQWENALSKQKPDLFVGSQDFLLWAARHQYLQPLREENIFKVEARFRDSLNRWVAIWVDPWVVVYNRERTVGSMREHSISWLRNDKEPKYRWVFPDIGNPNGDQRNVDFYRILMSHFGQEEFYKRINLFRPEIQNYVENSNHGVRMVLLGQADFSFAHYSDLEIYRRDELPLSWFRMDVNPATLYGVGIGRVSRHWDRVNKIIDFWQDSGAEWGRKAQIPWFRVYAAPESLIFGVGNLNDREDQVFLDDWLSEFRFGTLQKGIEE